MKRGTLLAIVVLAASCAGPRAAEREVSAVVASVPRVLAEEGPEGWLGFFAEEPGFRMLSDGAVAFDGYAAAAAFLESWGPSVSRMELTWSEPRVRALTPAVATFESGYAETLVDASGEQRFTGRCSGVFVRRAGGWRLVTLHWSSPREP